MMEISRILAIWKCFRRKGRKDAMKREWLSKNTVKGQTVKRKGTKVGSVVSSQDSLLVQAVGLPSGAAAHPLPARKG